VSPRVFLDVATIHVKAGDGGNGCVAFRREKYVPRGGPSGGDGGDGGSVILQASRDYNTLFHFKKYPHHKAKRGQHGMGSQCRGRNGDDVTLFVPRGTVVTDAETGELLGDLVEEGQKLVVARGGKGGRGNMNFATPVHQAPRHAEEGQPGEIRSLHLELKLMAQAGLVGLPNAGKSTLLSSISSARPKIADYPFTTLQPQLGVVAFEDGFSFIVAEIPGIIEGAREGKGLGLQFLRHTERVSLLCHLVDISDGSQPLKDLETLDRELSAYHEDIHEIPRIVVGTKLDASTDQSNYLMASQYARDHDWPFLALSAVSRSGIKEFLSFLREKIQQ